MARFYDATDGVTIEGALTITNERITLAADTDDGSAPTLVLDNITGATAGTDNDLNYITGTDAGLMQLELSAANTNRLGRMMLSITDAANHAPVFHELMVVNSAVYDAFYATSGGAIPNVVAGGSGGLLISGTNTGTTTLGALTCTGTFTISDGVVVTRSTADQAAISATGNGAGNAVNIIAGATSHALFINNATGGGGYGVFVNSTSNTAVIFSSAASHGFASQSTGGNGHAISLTGQGSGSALRLVAGSTGNALNATTTAGDCFVLSPTAGHGINIAANGTSKHGILSTGGTAGTSDGASLVAGSGGVGMRVGSLTSTGAVSFGSTFAVTTSSSLGALSCTTLTASGAVAFQSTLAVTTSTSLAALSATTITASGTTSLAAVTTSGTVTLNALTVSNATTLTGAVSLGSTLGVTGTTTLSALTVTNATNLTGAVTFGSTWTVTGATTFTGAWACNGGVTYTSATGTGFTCNSTGGNGHGFASSGNGTGHGLLGTGGVSGNGIYGVGGTTIGYGLAGSASVAGYAGLSGFGTGAAAVHGALFTATGAGNAFRCISSTGDAMRLSTTSSGDGLRCSGLNGLRITGALDGSGVFVEGDGAGHAVELIAGATGDGVRITAGSTSGDVIRGSATSGHGAILTGGTNGDGVRVVSAGTGVDINCAGDGRIQADVAGRILGDTATAFSGIGAQVDTRQFLGSAVVLDANNFPGINVRDWNGTAVGALPTNFSSLSIDASGRVTLAPAGLDAITVETGLNARQALSLIAATTGGILSGGGTVTEVFRAAVENATTRVTATVDSNGNRSAIVYNLPV